jgi:hypothetical protein
MEAFQEARGRRMAWTQSNKPQLEIDEKVPAISTVEQLPRKSRDAAGRLLMPAWVKSWIECTGRGLKRCA